MDWEQDVHYIPTVNVSYDNSGEIVEEGVEFLRVVCFPFSCGLWMGHEEFQYYRVSVRQFSCSSLLSFAPLTGFE